MSSLMRIAMKPILWQAIDKIAKAHSIHPDDLLGQGFSELLIMISAHPGIDLQSFDESFRELLVHASKISTSFRTSKEYLQSLIMKHDDEKRGEDHSKHAK